MSQKHYLPKAYSALSAWLITFINYLAGNLQRFGITPEEFEPVRNKAAEYNLAHIKAEEPNAGSADRLNRKKKAEEVSTETREFVNEHLRFNKNVTEEDKVNLGLTVPDPEPSPAPPPKTAPKGTVDYSKRQKHLLRVKDSHYSGRAKPDHVRGFEAWYTTLENPSQDSDFLYAGFSSNDHLEVNYPLNMVGSLILYRFRWKSTRNEPGPWSEIVSAIIN